jgi:hypothetical protein
MLVTTYTLTNIITHGHTIPNDHWAVNISYYTDRLAQCPQCYGRAIEKIVKHFANLCCPKTFNDPDHSIGIVEYQRKKFSPNLTPHRNSNPGQLLAVWFYFL